MNTLYTGNYKALIKEIRETQKVESYSSVGKILLKSPE